MPNGRRKVIFGDKCRDCDDIITELTGVRKGFHLQSRCKKCKATRRNNKLLRLKN